MYIYIIDRKLLLLEVTSFFCNRISCPIYMEIFQKEVMSTTAY